MLLNKIEFLAMNNPIRAFIQDKVEAKNFRKLSSLGPGKTILEIGCGNGNGTVLIQKYFRPKKIFAVDLDTKMIEIAVKNNRDPATSFEVGDVSKLRFKEGQFDAVFDFGIIHHVPGWKDCISEARRVLKPGGQFIIEDLSFESFETISGRVLKKMTDHPYEKMYRKQEFLDSLGSLGFHIVFEKSYNPLGLLKYFVVIAKKL